MTTELLSDLLRDLLRENDRVFLPGMGTFFAEVMPASITNNGNTINPPYKKIYFRSTETWNDGVLENSYAEKSSLDFEVARKKIEVFIKEFIKELNIKKSVDLPGLGIMRSTKEKNYFFVAEDGLDLYNDAFGLEPISLKKIIYSDRDNIETEPKQSYQHSSSEYNEYEKRQKKQRRQKRKRLSKGWIIAISIIGALLLLVAIFLLLVYLESPLLDKLLYSDEELRLLRGY